MYAAHRGAPYFIPGLEESEKSHDKIADYCKAAKITTQMRDELSWPRASLLVIPALTSGTLPIEFVGIVERCYGSKRIASITRTEEEMVKEMELCATISSHFWEGKQWKNANSSR